MAKARVKVDVPALASAFLMIGESAEKIAPQVRALIGNLEGDALNKRKKALFDAIREKGEGRKDGKLPAWKKCGARVQSARVAASMAIMRAIRARGTKGAPKVSPAQYAYNAARAAISKLQDTEGAPSALVAAWRALETVALANGAKAKEAAIK